MKVSKPSTNRTGDGEQPLPVLSYLRLNWGKHQHETEPEGYTIKFGPFSQSGNSYDMEGAIPDELFGNIGTRIDSFTLHRTTGGVTEYKYIGGEDIICDYDFDFSTRTVYVNITQDCTAWER